MSGITCASASPAANRTSVYQLSLPSARVSAAPILPRREGCRSGATSACSLKRRTKIPARPSASKISPARSLATRRNSNVPPTSFSARAAKQRVQPAGIGGEPIPNRLLPSGMSKGVSADLDRGSGDLPGTERLADRLGDSGPRQRKAEPQAAEPVGLGEGAQDHQPDLGQRRRQAQRRIFEIGEGFIDNHQRMTFFFAKMREDVFRLQAAPVGIVRDCKSPARRRRVPPRDLRPSSRAIPPRRRRTHSLRTSARGSRQWRDERQGAAPKSGSGFQVPPPPWTHRLPHRLAPPLLPEQ